MAVEDRWGKNDTVIHYNKSDQGPVIWSLPTSLPFPCSSGNILHATPFSNEQEQSMLGRKIGGTPPIARSLASSLYPLAHVPGIAKLGGCGQQGGTGLMLGSKVL